MSESEWLWGLDPSRMLEFLRNSRKASDRKLRLFCCACFRRLAHVDRDLKGVIELSERLADGLATNTERREKWRTLVELASPDFLPEAYMLDRSALVAADEGSKRAAKVVAFRTVPYAPEGFDLTNRKRVVTFERMQQTERLREIFGNPWGCSSLLPASVFAWNDGAIHRIALGIYADRAFDCTPILADALEDAGCADSQILDHLREAGPHVRGCWVVDHILAKN